MQSNRAGLAQRFKAHIKNHLTAKLSMKDLKQKLAEECKKRTKSYFNNLPGGLGISEKALKAAKIIKHGGFGCATDNVGALVTLLMGEDVTAALAATQREHPDSGVMILFLSERLSKANWVPSLCLKQQSGVGMFVNNFEDQSEGGSVLSGEQVNTARMPTDDVIDEYFDKISAVNLRGVLGSEFGIDVVTAAAAV